MTTTPRVRTLAGAALLLLATTACGSSGSDTAAPAAATPPPTAASSAPTPAASPPATRGPRTQADLESALLTLSDMGSGYAVDRGEDEQDEGGSVSSTDPACAPLVAVLDSDATAGATASASVSLDGGLDAPSIDESLDALPGAAAAVAAVEAELRAVQDCAEVTIALPDAGDVDFAVDEISFPSLGDSRFGVRMTALDEELGGFELMTAVVAVDDVVVHTTFFDTFVEDAEEMTKLAVDKIGRTRSSDT